MITVILNGYKRAKHLDLQLKSIENQSLKPKEVMLWQNYGDSFDVELTSKTIHASCNKNLGVWARFAFALNAKTDYICVFDDDTIPGFRWLENCYNTIQKYDGLLGTVGLIFNDPNNYINNTRFGWPNPNNEALEVDIVGHSWFFKRDDLSTFWREMPSLNQDILVGEDIHFSYTLQKYMNKKTYVPPHPKDNIDMWGSIPETAWSIGTEKVGISMNSDNIAKMNETFINYQKKGFKILKNV